MLMIRFQRIGRKNDAAFRIAVLEKTAGPKAGKYVDLVGTYNPKTKTTNLKADAIRAWMAKGAQVSPSVHNLLVKEGVVEGTKIPVIAKSTLEKHIAKRKAEEEAAAAKAKEAEEKAAAAAAAAAAEAAPAEEASVEEAPAAEEVAAEEAPATEAAPEEAPAAA